MHQLVRELWQRHHPAILLVTHDVDEAISLSDRLLVLEEGWLAHDVAIDLPSPREHGHARFLDYRQQLLAALGVGPGARASEPGGATSETTSVRVRDVGKAPSQHPDGGDCSSPTVRSRSPGSRAPYPSRARFRRGGDRRAEPHGC